MKKIALILAAVTLCTLLSACFSKPAEEEPVTTGTQTEAVTEAPTEKAEETEKPATKEPEKGPAAAEGSYNFLVLGRDKTAYLTDSIMIVNLNTEERSLTLMQIPRDTYIAGGYPTGKINAVYSTIYHNQLRNYHDEKEAGLRTLEEYSRLIEGIFQIRIDYAAIMNLEGFRNIVDAVGGLDIEVPFHMYYSDPNQGLYIDIPPGEQHLDGNRAEQFVRFRSGYANADLGRQDAQKRFMFKFFKKIRSSFKVTELAGLTKLATEIRSHLLTDVPAADMVAFAKELLRVEDDRIKMFTVPGSMSGGYCVINKAGAIRAMNEYFNADGEEITAEKFDPERRFDNHSGVYDYPAESALFGRVYSSEDEIVAGRF